MRGEEWSGDEQIGAGSQWRAKGKTGEVFLSLGLGRMVPAV